MTTLRYEKDLQTRKIDLVLALYVEPADQDYLTARWAFGNGIFYAFYHAAAQAFEKYAKATLLLSDQDTRGYGHDLMKLHEAVVVLDRRGLMPTAFDLPETTAMGREAWQGKEVALFTDYLRQYGSPDNRYGIHGTFVNGPVLHALDIVCVAFRRIMRVVNMTGEDLFEVRNAQVGFYDRVDEPCDWMIDPRTLLEQLFIGRYSVGQSSALRRQFLNMNLAFSAERDENERTFGGQHFHGSPLHNQLVRLGELDPSEENRATIAELRAWARDRIHISAPIRRQLGF